MVINSYRYTQFEIIHLFELTASEYTSFSFNCVSISCYCVFIYYIHSNDFVFIIKLEQID